MEATINNLVNAIGWTILHSLWQGAIIFALLLIIFAINKKWSAKAKHNLSLAALLLIFVAFCVTFGQLFNLPSTVKHLAPLNDSQFRLSSTSFNSSTERYFPFLSALYLLGLICQMVVITVSYIKLKQLKKTIHQNFPEDWFAVAEQILEKLQLKKKVKFYLSDKVNVPLVIGFLKPVVLFPLAFVNALDVKQVEAILIHELSHVRRNDYLLNIVKTAIETLLFFNPFVWLSSRIIQIERENACDDLVVSHTNSPVAYAHVLLKLELIKDKSKPALSLAATGRNQYLYERIKRITNMKTTYMNTKQRLIAFTLTLVAVIGVALMNPKKATARVEIKNKIENIKLFNAKNTYSLKLDTDTVVKRKHYRKITVITKDGKTTTYKESGEMPDSLKLKFEELGARFNISDSSFKKIDLKIPEIATFFDSNDWKEKAIKIELNAKKMSQLFNSKDWKDKIEKMEFDSKKLEDIVNAKEWKDNIVKIELNGKKLEDLMKSKDWTDKLNKLDFHSKKFDDIINSKEWRDRMGKIELRSTEMEKTFGSPEWKKKMKETEELHNSKEYKELRDRYEKELEQLKKKKGLSKAGMSFHFDSTAPAEIAITTLGEHDGKPKATTTTKVIVRQM